jgi:predicted enzyme related to lactoylglutathione lyase
MRKHGTFAWNELAASNAQEAMDFYGATLDWTFEKFELPDGAYWVAKAGDEFIAGVGGWNTSAEPTATRSAWYAFIEVDDVDARVTLALAHGATIVQPPHDVPNVGRVAVIRDPTGAVIGLMRGL